MKTVLSIILCAALTSCISTTKITGSWRSNNIAQGSYESAFIAVFSGNAVTKSLIENHLAEYLNKSGIRTLKSMNEFPPTFLSDTVDRKLLIGRVEQTQTECILVITILKKESDYRFIPGSTVYRPDQYPHSARLRDYYLYWQPCTYDPCYYVKNEVYYLETNLYDGVTQDLVWSAQSETYTLEDIHALAHSYASKITKQLKKEKVLKPNTQLKTEKV